MESRTDSKAPRAQNTSNSDDIAPYSNDDKDGEALDKEPVCKRQRYSYWNEDASFTLEARERSDTQTIGTANSRDIPKDKVIVTLRKSICAAAQ